MIVLWVPGEPKTQGSMRHVGNGRMIHPKGLTQWRDQITAAARQYTGTHFGAWEPIDQPVEVKLEFRLPRPQKPRWGLPANRWDIDKLARAVLDALAPKVNRKTPPWAVLHDDARVVSLYVEKHYADEITPAGVWISVEVARGYEGGQA